MVWYFFGDDSWAARKSVDAVASEQQARIKFVDKSDLAEKSVVSLLSQGGGLFDKDLLVLRNVGGWAKSYQEELLEALKKYPDSLCVIWEREKVDRRSKVYKTYGKQGKEFVVPGRQQLMLWVKEEVRESGGEIEDKAAEVLVDRVGGDRWRLKSELMRLMLMSEVIKSGDVEDSVPVSAEAEVFEMLEALVDGRRGVAMKQMKTLLSGGESEFYILSMLAYQFRTLLAVRDGIDRGFTANDIASKGKMNPYAVQKSMGPAKKKPAIVWREDLRKILATDFLIKQGKAEARTALQMLMLSL